MFDSGKQSRPSLFFVCKVWSGFFLFKGAPLWEAPTLLVKFFLKVSNALAYCKTQVTVFTMFYNPGQTSLSSKRAMPSVLSSLFISNAPNKMD